MRKLTLAVAFAALMATTGVLAASHDQPGTPGDKNCVGLTNAALAQIGVAAGAAHPGLGGLVALVSLTVKEIQDVVQAYCAGS